MSDRSPSPACGRRWAAARTPIVGIAVLAFAVFSAYSLSRADQLLTAGYDLGIFDQAIRAYSRFEPPLSPLKGDDYVLLGDHFHPILVLLAPLYWIWDDGRVLLVAQAALVAGSSVFVWRVARWRAGVVASGLLVVGFLLGRPLQALIDFDVHEIAFAVPVLAWAIAALDSGSDRQLVGAAMLLLLIREDMGTVVLVLGLLRAARRPRTLGVALAALGAAAFALIVLVVIPAIGGRGYAYWDYGALGVDAGGVVRTVLTRPWVAVGLFFAPMVKTVTLLGLLAPLLLLPLLSPVSLLALPLLAERFLSDRSALWTSGFHYDAPVWIVLVLGAIDGGGRVLQRVRSSGYRARALLLVGVLVCAVPVVGTAVCRDTAAFPLARMITGDAWSRSRHMMDQAAAIDRVPAGTCVAADDRLVPALTRTNRVSLPGVLRRPPDFLLLDLSQEEAGTVRGLELRTTVIREDALADGYRVVARFGEVEVLESPTYRGPSDECAR
ncbi:DUF2079 domain-containing protein [Rathayibacter sp. VKM Ac-2760]|uniref:DUF2079 domain-containing protein n=1 Tax=Rathayibacter sp. VKM Ac-2760 TaxID=2609253 RepID=UPI00131683F2|nr:DUF2079 domain-containing protein [Rathayibacter sp. VKM Ac-2760]QHC59605.1 DUF2079 domain-containing protein [Rathayibacter sp. VKM Ac-2760]